MALSNHDRVGKALDLLKDGLLPFVERELKAQHGKYWITTVTSGWRHDLNWSDSDDVPHLDSALVLRLMWEQWNEVFRRTLGHAERSLVSELRNVRNQWAHQEAFSGDDAYRALDSTARLLTAIAAPEAEAAEKLKMELLRVRFDEQVRSEKRRTASALIESHSTAGLKPWREVVTPHRDVASGRYQQAEFAADLWQVHLGQGSDEYRDPAEFFRRTYLTESLTQLLIGGVRRLAGTGGDPVVQLQTNFGGGKTHSMLALYHLFSGVEPAGLVGIDAVLQEAGETLPPKVQRVVLVGNKISPGNPSTKEDGTRVHTLWGELAWQLGGRQAYERIRADDERATNPGDVLRELFVEHGPCLILIDEWVAYARQLHDNSDLPAGGFETQFSFAQALTESAKLAKNCLLVISLPASDTSGASPHTHADDTEVGGQRGREALERLRNVVGRLESSWRPASAEEGFEIVRRRLFEDLPGPEQFRDRDVVARAFAELYRSHPQDFPPECRDADYEKRIRAAYPIHPEVFDRLYTDWSTLLKFQRTRGVLRLMATVIYALWERGDRNPLIMPSTIPIDDLRVQPELTRYLSDNWAPVIAKDVDGPNSLPLRTDAEVPALGKYAACRRVARTIYLGSAPTVTAAHRGLEDRRVRLGSVMPGESPAAFDDALRRLAGSATYLYQDGPRYWFATQPTVTKVAEDRAEQLRRDPDKVAEEVASRVRGDVRQAGDFRLVHPLPRTSGDVPDSMDARLVVLGIDQPYSRESDSPAETASREILEQRGNSPRLYRNSLVFLAADRTRLADLDESVRRFLAWTSILDEREILDLSPHQVRQAETQLRAADSTVSARLPETYQWLIVPTQKGPTGEIKWTANKLTGHEGLAVRASRRMRSDDSLVPNFGENSLRNTLDSVPLWRGDSVSIKQIVDDFSRYIYLPRLVDPDVLLEAIRNSVTAASWEREGVALAESFDLDTERYGGLKWGERPAGIDAFSSTLLVKPETALRQRRAEQAEEEDERQKVELPSTTDEPDPDNGGKTIVDPGPVKPPPPPKLTRYYGTARLDAARVGLDASKIAENIVAHLVGLEGARVTVTLDIEASIPAGVPEHVVRIVSENGTQLRFEQQGFEGQ